MVTSAASAGGRLGTARTTKRPDSRLVSNAAAMCVPSGDQQMTDPDEGADGSSREGEKLTPEEAAQLLDALAVQEIIDEERSHVALLCGQLRDLE